MIDRQRLVDSFIRMTAISSVSGQEHEFRDYLRKEFEKRGFSVEEDGAGNASGGTSGNLLITVPGTKNLSPLLFAAHMDTVEPGRNIKAVIADNEVIKSSGETILGADDKAAIAALLESVDIISENQLECPPLEILFTVSEERGLLGIKHFDFSKLNARFGYTLDGGGSPGTVVIKSPCQNEIEYIAYGIAAHAGIDPENGLNAIKLTAIAMAQMPCGRIDEETTCNFGIIRGGRARNIVADECLVRGEARSLDREKLDRLTQELQDQFVRSVTEGGGQAEVKVGFLYPQVSLRADDEVVKLAVKAIENIGLPPQLIETGGGSDASIINAYIPCANLGIGMQEVHTTREHILIKDLIDDVRLILAIIAEYCC